VSKAVILVVDDEELNRAVFRDALQAEGYEVFTAAGTAEAVAVLDAREVGAIVCDIHMPHNGLKLYEYLRTVPVKYYLQDASGAFVSNLASFVSLMYGPVACDTTAPGVLVEETDAAGSTTIRYDAASLQFIYNWKTDKSWTGCRVLQLTLDDGTRYLALFQFK
jgi:hypothetical protein